MVAHARILLPVELQKKIAPARYWEAMFQIWWRSVDILSTDAGRTDVILYCVQCYASHWTDNYQIITDLNVVQNKIRHHQKLGVTHGRQVIWATAYETRDSIGKK